MILFKKARMADVGSISKPRSKFTFYFSFLKIKENLTSDLIKIKVMICSIFENDEDSLNQIDDFS